MRKKFIDLGFGVPQNSTIPENIKDMEEEESKDLADIFELYETWSKNQRPWAHIFSTTVSTDPNLITPLSFRPALEPPTNPFNCEELDRQRGPSTR